MLCLFWIGFIMLKGFFFLLKGTAALQKCGVGYGERRAEEEEVAAAETGK